MVNYRNKDIILNNIYNNAKNKIIIATQALCMGVNIPNIQKVIIYGPFNSIELYLQAAGRIGREPNMNHQECILLYNNKLIDKNVDQYMQSYIDSKDVTIIYYLI